MTDEAIVDGGLEEWLDAEDLTYWAEGGAPQAIYREATVKHDGDYSARMRTTAPGELTWFSQNISMMRREIRKIGLWYINILEDDALTDGAMEEWTSPTNLTNWTEGGAPQEIHREDTIVHGGAHSARIYTDTPGDFTWFYQDISMIPTERRRITLWYINPTGGNIRDLRLYIFDPGNNVWLKPDGTWAVVSDYIPLPKTPVWTKFELEFTVHPDYSDYRVRFYKGHSVGEPASSYYVDDVTLIGISIKDLRLYLRDSGSTMWLKSDGTWQAGMTFVPLPVVTEWTEFELEFTAPKCANYNFQIYKGHEAVESGSSYCVDDLSTLLMGEEAPPPGIWLGPQCSEQLLPRLKWLGESPPAAWAVSINKEMETARMSEGSLRFAFFGTRKVFQIEYPFLSAEWLEKFKALNVLNQNLRFMNTLEGYVWHDVAITVFGYTPARMDIRQLKRYKVILTLEETDYRARVETRV